MEKYKVSLVDNASKLDAITNACGDITRLATSVVEENSKENTVLLIRRIFEIIDGSKYNIEIKRLAQMVNSNLIEYYGYSTLQSICRKDEHSIEDNRTLEELLDELNQLVGLQNVKQKVYDLLAYQKIQLLRKEHNLFLPKNTLHLVFTGNPGTGKTTVARIIGHLYKKIGLLSKGHFMEVSRTDLISGYQGQTALKVKNLIDKAKGGVLFIDEAYSITENEHSDSYGRECLTELTKALEDYRNDLVVIVAGYTEPMKKFFESNPGLKSRFNTFIEFQDYDKNELYEILLSICKVQDYVLEEKLNLVIQNHINKLCNNKNENFANGRLIRNLYENLVMNHARRVSNVECPTKEDLILLKEEDFKEEI